MVFRRITLAIATFPVALLLEGAGFRGVDSLNGATPDGRSTKPAPVLFLLDASGSMAERFHGVPRFAAARVLILEKLDRLAPGTPVGLMAYGNLLPGCDNYRIYVEPSIGNRYQVMKSINSMYPAGATPLANSLRLANRILVPEHPNLKIIVISDGAESCGGDPAAEATLISKNGGDVQVHIIGLAVDAPTAHQLAQVAKAGRGVYFGVNNHTEFDAAIKNALDPNYAPLEPVSDTTASVIEENAQEGEQVLYQKERGDEAPGHGSILWIQRVVQVSRGSGSVIVDVEYRFETPIQSDYQVSLYHLNKALTAGPSMDEPMGERLERLGGSTHYTLQNGSGTIRMEITSEIKQNQPIMIQGELWDIRDVPESIYISRAVEISPR